jgi:DNA invertase Pin-like site-specific DNA recombinase
VREQVAHTYGRRGNKSVILSVWNRKVWALFRSIKQLLDSTGPFRAVMVLMFASLAKQEAARISERTKAGLRVAKAGGKTVAPSPHFLPRYLFLRQKAEMIVVCQIPLRNPPRRKLPPPVKPLRKLRFHYRFSSYESDARKSWTRL